MKIVSTLKFNDDLSREIYIFFCGPERLHGQQAF